ncbi:MAG TPA: acyltransferase [Candidatus Woesebacteria bacterium]|nr:acyltransferase [Candidatus Woesebacteria bacterium]
MQERNTTIDFLRGFSVIIIILIHVNAYFVSIPIANWLANYAQFAVQIFVFCSAFIFFERKRDDRFTFSYFIKRIKRLLIPYYIFLFFYFLFLIFIKQSPISVDGLLKWIFLIGDRDLHWLVVLFLYFLVLMPFISFIKNDKLLFWLFFILSTASSIVLLFIQFPVPFRWIMWLPWSLVLFFTYFYTISKHKKLFLSISTIITGIIFVVSKYLLIAGEHTLSFKGNKYPPNIFYLSYGLLCISIFILIYEQFNLKKYATHVLFNFASKFSYEIFFIHFLYLFIFVELTNYKQFTWWGLFLIITVLSLGTMFIWSKKNYFFSILKKAN